MARNPKRSFGSFCFSQKCSALAYRPIIVRLWIIYSSHPRDWRPSGGPRGPMRTLFSCENPSQRIRGNHASKHKSHRAREQLSTAQRMNIRSTIAGKGITSARARLTISWRGSTLSSDKNYLALTHLLWAFCKHNFPPFQRHWTVP